MSIKKISILVSAFPLLLIIIFVIFLLIGISSDSDDNSAISTDKLNLSVDVIKYRPIVEKYAKEYDISEYVNYLLAIMQVESGGKGKDPMQSSESMGLPPDTLDVEASIKQGCKHFASLLKSSKEKACDMNTVIQSYNYGGNYINYIADNGKKHTFEFSESFAKDKSHGEKVKYTNPIAIKKNGGWRYKYGNMFYVELVNEYLFTNSFDDKTLKIVMDEALKYQGWPYVFGGYNPTSGFDCSGLVQWCYGKAGITLPRVAQEQYDVTQHIPLEDAKPGDLVFFHSTYDAGTYVTHVGIYLSPTKFYQSGGDGIGYQDLKKKYWKAHLIGIGRIKR